MGLQEYVRCCVTTVGFEEYYCKGLHGIATDLILKETNNVNF